MTAARTPASSVQSPSGTSWAALTVLMFGTFMFVLDFFIVNVALPSIQHGLRAGESAIEWVVAGYAISTAVLLVTGGRLGDQFGRRRVFALGMALFVVTSAACALAPDPAMLVAARVAQGFGAPPPSRSPSHSPSTSGVRPTVAGCPCLTHGCSPPGRCAPG